MITPNSERNAHSNIKTLSLMVLISISSLVACGGTSEEINVQATVDASIAATKRAELETQSAIDAVIQTPTIVEPTDTPIPPPSEPTNTTAPPTPIPPTSAPPTTVPQPVHTQASDSLEWVVIPSSNFIMGSTEAEMQTALAECKATRGDCQEWLFEGDMPQETIFVNQFEITRYEVTNALYNQCVAAGNCEPAKTNITDSNIPYHPDFFADANPVVGVTATDASIFCRWVGGRLPTRAEWEKAARGIDGRQFPWGNTFDPAKANFSSTHPAPVGSYPDGASPYGVMDMAGNVLEWTADDARLGGHMPPSIVLRGGGWNSYPFEGRAAYRGIRLSPGLVGYDIGFRCARDETGTAIVQQTPSVTVSFKYKQGVLYWSVRTAAEAYVTCYIAGGTIASSWHVDTEGDGSAPAPEGSVTCALVATGYDGSKAAETVTFGSGVDDCDLQPAETFTTVWQDFRYELGCPTSEQVTIPMLAEQAFQGGHMFWRSDTDAVYVIYGPEGKWQTDPNWKWDGSNPDGIGLSPPPGLFEPRRGFGWLWRTHLGREGGPLGWALEEERGFDNTGQAQVFERGIMLKGGTPRVYVLLYKDQLTQE